MTTQTRAGMVAGAYGFPRRVALTPRGGALPGSSGCSSAFGCRRPSFRSGWPACGRGAIVLMHDAHAFVHGAGAMARARTVAEAISLHLNIAVPARLGAEAHLLSKGVSLDVVGRRLHEIDNAEPSANGIRSR